MNQRPLIARLFALCASAAVTMLSFGMQLGLVDHYTQQADSLQAVHCGQTLAASSIPPCIASF